MKLFKLIFSIILIFWSVYVAGQKTSVRFLPKGFKSYCKSSEISLLVTNKLEFERFSNDFEKGTEWRVFSLNSSNILYRSYDCTDENGSKLDFMQPLLVLDVIGNSLKVCDPATRHPLGWLSASQLVLSDHSLLNPNGLPRKAILLTSLNDIFIAGNDRKFIKAEAYIENNKLIVFSPSIKEPVAVRYAWNSTDKANLFNGANLPASPFRTDNWENIIIE